MNTFVSELSSSARREPRREERDARNATDDANGARGAKPGRQLSHRRHPNGLISSSARRATLRSCTSPTWRAARRSSSSTSGSPTWSRRSRNHPGVGLLLVRSAEHGALVIGPIGRSPSRRREVRGRRSTRGVRRSRGTLAGQPRRDVQLRRPRSDQHVRSRHAAGVRVRGADRLARRARRRRRRRRCCSTRPTGSSTPRSSAPMPSTTQLRSWMKTATPDNAVVDPDELIETAKAAA